MRLVYPKSVYRPVEKWSWLYSLNYQNFEDKEAPFERENEDE